MIRSILLHIIILVCSLPAQCQYFQVSEPRKVQLPEGCKSYHPVFTPDGRHLAVTSESFAGLALVGLDSDAPDYRRLSDKPGVGYKVAVDNDGGILHGCENSEHGIAVIEDNLKMVVCTDGICRLVDPISDQFGRDVNYCWTSVSPDGTLLLFVAHNNAYTSRLDGSDLVDLGPLHAPVWCGNDWVVGMIDSDDGHYITASEIFIVDARNATNRQQLTPSDMLIKMYPAVSSDGRRVAYNSIDGDIYIIDFKTVGP